MKLVLAVLDAQSIGGIDNPYQSICFLKVVSPVRPQSLLPANVPWIDTMSCKKAQRSQRSKGVLTYVEFVSGARPLESDRLAPSRYCLCLPLVVDSLDDETERRADGVDILSHNLFDNCRLSCIVQAPDDFSHKFLIL